jgi:hypothetical protein
VGLYNLRGSSYGGERVSIQLDCLVESITRNPWRHSGTHLQQLLSSSGEGCG